MIKRSDVSKRYYARIYSKPYLFAFLLAQCTKCDLAIASRVIVSDLNLTKIQQKPKIVLWSTLPVIIIRFLNTNFEKKKIFKTKNLNKHLFVWFIVKVNANKNILFK